MTSLPIDSEEFRSQLKNMSEDIKVGHTNSTKKTKSPIDNLKSKSIYKDTLTVINFLAKNGDNLPKRYAEFFNRALWPNYVTLKYGRIKLISDVSEKIVYIHKGNS